MNPQNPEDVTPAKIRRKDSKSALKDEKDKKEI